MTDFFISYTCVDRSWAEWIAWQLEATGYTTVIQAWDFRPGSNFVVDMQRAATGSERTIAVLSPAYLRSGFTEAEWAAAFARDPTGTQGLLLPVRIQDCEPRGMLPQIVYIDLVGLDVEAARDMLLAGVRRQRAKPTREPGFPGPSPRPATEPPLFPGSIPHNIPFLGSGHFVGRQADLEALHHDLTRTERIPIALISGMGGIGKTELAVQYARHHLHDYPGGVCWLNGRTGDLSAQVIDYVQHTLMREVPQERGGQPLTLVQQLTWCWQTWQPPGRVLLVLDDVTALAPCQPILLAPPERFRLVLTTRQRGLEPSFAERPLEVLVPAAALALLTGLAGAERVDTEDAVAQELCAWLGYLPLGVELVGRYLAQDRGVSLAEMWEQFQETERPLEDLSLEGGYPLMTAQRGVRAAFELSWHELDPDAQDVARLLSLCAPVAVSWELATRAMQQVQGETYRIRSARRQLDNLHLVQPVERRAEMVRLHPLIREFLHDKQDSAAEPSLAQEELKRALVQTMVKIAQDIPQTPTLETIQTLLPLIPHLEEVAEQCTEFFADDELLWPFVGLGRFYGGQGLYTLAEPWYMVCLKKTQKRFGAEHFAVAASLNNLADLYQAQGRYREAEPLSRDALAMWKRLLGEEHPTVAASLNNLATLYREQGRYSEAEPLSRDALAMWKRLLGEEHPTVAASLNNLAALYWAQGRYREAEPLYRDALAMRKRLLGEEHPTVAASLNNLAALYWAQGRYREAEPLSRDALAMRKRLLGEEHPEVATSLNNLALLYQAQGRYREAEPLSRDALAMRKRLLGEEHPEVATSLNNLATLYEEQGRYREAEPLSRDALAMWKRLLGEEHPAVAASLNNLAALYRAQGRYREAEPLYRDALAMRKRLLGEEHPEVATSLNNLATLYREQGRYSEAEPLSCDALAMWKRLLGEEHPTVAASLNNLAALYWEQGRYREAEPLYRDALAMRKRLLGEEHPEVATSLNNLALLYRAQERYREAEPLSRDALAMRKRLLGEEHPAVATSLNNLALLYQAQGRYSEAEPLFRDALAMRKRLLGEEHPEVAISLNNLALLYASQVQFEVAMPLLEHAVRMLRQLLGEEHPSTQRLHQNLEWVKAAMR